MCNSCSNGCLPSSHSYSIGTYPAYSLNCGHNCYCVPAQVCAPTPSIQSAGCQATGVLKTKYEPTKPPVFWAKAEHKAAITA